MTVTLKIVDQDITLKSLDVNSIIRASETIERALSGISGISRAILVIEEFTCRDFNNLTDEQRNFVDTHYNRYQLMEVVETLASDAYDDILGLNGICGAINQIKSQLKA